MASKKDFEIGDLVWAKMKSFPYWPAKIVKPPTPAPSKKLQHYVYFFGSANHAWIQVENIVHHSEKMLQSTPKKKAASLKLAIEQISQECESDPKMVESPVKEKELETKQISQEGESAPEMAKPLVKEKELPVEISQESEAIPKMAKPSSEKESPKISPEASTSSTERKITKVEKDTGKTESHKVQKKTSSKKRHHDESANTGTSPPRKLSKKSEDYSTLISNTLPNIACNRIAVIKPIYERPYSLPSAAITRRDYFELEPLPPLELKTISETLKAKNVKPTDKKIGFIGLGMMGQRLVRNLIHSGHQVTVWNRTPEKCNDFVEIGASSALAPCDVVEKCDLIFCCVSGSNVSRNLFFGNCGILSGLKKSSPGLKGYIELSTLDPSTSLEIARAVIDQGHRYLEAPISGSRVMAEDGSLLVLGAGSYDLFTSCHSCFWACTENVLFIGSDVGSASKMKVILSMLMGTAQAALGEALALVERCKLSPHNFLEILELGPLNSSLHSEKGNAIVKHSFTTNNTIKYQQKDINLALSLGNVCEQQLLVTTSANELYKRAKLLRYSDHDVSAVYLGSKY